MVFVFTTASLTHRQIIFDQKFLCFYVNMLNLNAVCFANYYTVALYIYFFLHFIISIKHFRCQKIMYARSQSNVLFILQLKEPVHRDDDRAYEWKSSHNYFGIDTRQIFKKIKRRARYSMRWAALHQLYDWLSTSGRKLFILPHPYVGTYLHARSLRYAPFHWQVNFSGYPFMF